MDRETEKRYDILLVVRLMLAMRFVARRALRNGRPTGPLGVLLLIPFSNMYASIGRPVSPT